MDGKLPEPEGVYIADCLSAQELSRLPDIERAGLSLKLSDMQSDFVFFNHGILFTEIRLDTDPVQEFVYRSGQSDSVFFLSYDRPLFRNLVSAFWNSVIFGCKKELWPELRRTLNGILFKANDNKVYSCFLQNVYLPDPYLWNGSTENITVPLSDWGDLCEKADRGLNGDARYSHVVFPAYPEAAKIHVMGVSGPDRLAYMKSGLKPYIVYDDPEPETLALQEVINKHVS
jgi:hypothetical protein